MMRLLALQLPILLQLVQLWVVLGRLASPMDIDAYGTSNASVANATVEEESSPGTLAKLKRKEFEQFNLIQSLNLNLTVLLLFKLSQGDELLSCMQAVLLTSTEIQNVFALQCLFDALTVRSIFAVATPVIPVALLVMCGFLEFCRPGVGDFVAFGDQTS